MVEDMFKCSALSDPGPLWPDSRRSCPAAVPYPEDPPKAGFVARVDQEAHRQIQDSSSSMIYYQNSSPSSDLQPLLCHSML